MTKAELAELERVFTHEVNRAFSDLPTVPCPPRKNKTARRLVEDGYLDEVTVNLGGFRDNLGPMAVHGVELTHAGRMAYCATCKSEDSE